MNSQVLFLCTGNYYRSRFAERLFNHFAIDRKLQWQATSRGIAVDLGVKNIGPISPYTLQGLRERQIAIQEELAHPAQLQEKDLQRADRIIALHELEHRPLLQQRFSIYLKRVEFWDVPDVYLVAAPAALATIEENVLELIAELSATQW